MKIVIEVERSRRSYEPGLLVEVAKLLRPVVDRWAEWRLKSARGGATGEDGVTGDYAGSEEHGDRRSRSWAVGMACDSIRLVLRANYPRQVADLCERAADMPADCSAAVCAAALLRLHQLKDRVGAGALELLEAHERIKACKGMKVEASDGEGAQRDELADIEPPPARPTVVEPEGSL